MTNGNDNDNVKKKLFDLFSPADHSDYERQLILFDLFPSKDHPNYDQLEKNLRELQFPKKEELGGHIIDLQTRATRLHQELLTHIQTSSKLEKRTTYAPLKIRTIRAPVGEGTPPRVAATLLHIILSRKCDSLIGDLEEKYRTKRLPALTEMWGPRKGRFLAGLWYWKEALKEIGFGVLKLTGLVKIAAWLLSKLAS